MCVGVPGARTLRGRPGRELGSLRCAGAGQHQARHTHRVQDPRPSLAQGLHAPGQGTPRGERGRAIVLCVVVYVKRISCKTGTRTEGAANNCHLQHLSTNVQFLVTPCLSTESIRTACVYTLYTLLTDCTKCVSEVSDVFYDKFFSHNIT
jgi:hypothetical protein